MVSINKKLSELKEALSCLSQQQEFLNEILSAFRQNSDLLKELRESFASVLSQQSVNIINELEFDNFFNNQPFERLQVYLQEEVKNLNREETEKDCIFITGRYRTGTTFLYSLFSYLENTAVFYEPLHPDLLEYLDQSQNLSEQLKALNSHTFKGQYFEEYKVLNRDILFSLHQKEFGSRKLIMSTVDSYYDLKNYLFFLIRSLPDLPLKILQFNRVDFRLGWLKKNFPNALIVNLRRNPRDIYASYRSVNTRNMGENNEKEIGGLFYLDQYINLLGKLSSPQICVQQMNTYEKIYFLNQLSNLWSDYLADVILDYEELVEDPVGITSRIASQVKGFTPKWKNDEIVAAKKDRVVWQEYHESSWFLNCESKCDNLINQLLFPSRTKFPMIIRSEYEQAQSQLHQTQTELEESQSQLHQTLSELEESQSQLHQTQTELEQYKAQLESTQAELEQSRSELHQTAGSVEQYSSQLHQATAILEQYQSQLHQIETLWQQSQAQYHQTQRQLQQSQAQYHQTQQELQQSQAQYHQTQRELQQSQAQRHDTEALLSQLHVELCRVQRELKRSHSQLHQVQKELEESHTQLQHKDILLQKLNSQRHQIQGELKHSQFQIYQVQGELQQYQSQLHQTETVLQQYQSQLHQTETVLQQSQSQLHQTETVLQQSQSQLHQTETVLQQFQSQLHQAQAEKEQYQSQLDQAQAEKEQYQSQLDQAQAEKEQYQSQLDQAQAEKEQYQSQLDQAQAEKEQYQSQLDQAHRSAVKLSLEQIVASPTDSHNHTQYALLVWDAWSAYKKGDLSKMRDFLQQSLKYTHLSRTETVVNWLEQLARLSGEQGEVLNTDFLTNSNDWKQLMSQALTFKHILKRN